MVDAVEGGFKSKNDILNIMNSANSPVCATLYSDGY